MFNNNLPSTPPGDPMTRTDPAPRRPLRNKAATLASRLLASRAISRLGLPDLSRIMKARNSTEAAEMMRAPTSTEIYQSWLPPNSEQMARQAAQRGVRLPDRDA